MRRWLAMLALVSLVAPGCTMLDRTPKAAVAPKLQSPALPPVMPQEISAGNAREKARSLNEELDRDLDRDK